MTICIGVICDNAKKIILASDRMITAGFPLNIEFEPDAIKGEKLSNTCMILTAGSVLASVDLCKNVKNNISQFQALSVFSIAEEIKKEFVQERINYAEELHLKPLNLDFGTLYEGMRSLPGEFCIPLLEKIRREQLELEILLAGIDTDGSAHMYNIMDPGISGCFDSLGFCAIGTGTPHVVSTFTNYLYTPMFRFTDALYTLYKAKKFAERAPGVGNKTNVFVIDSEGIKEMPSKTVKELDELYKGERKTPSLNENKIKEILEIEKWKLMK